MWFCLAGYRCTYVLVSWLKHKCPLQLSKESQAETKEEEADRWGAFCMIYSQSIQQWQCYLRWRISILTGWPHVNLHFLHHMTGSLGAGFVNAAHCVVCRLFTSIMQRPDWNKKLRFLPDSLHHFWIDHQPHVSVQPNVNQEVQNVHILEEFHELTSQDNERDTNSFLTECLSITVRGGGICHLRAWEAILRQVNRKSDLAVFSLRHAAGEQQTEVGRPLIDSVGANSSVEAWWFQHEVWRKTITAQWHVIWRPFTDIVNWICRGLSSPLESIRLRSLPFLL